ncbi:hypothetical protein [Leclercia tamurae]|uniref:Colicin V n=1 Tax=Leclercia tamurae TaxID=2926467 RepID=A0ABT2RC80_9ENTR|nr:hypothetical protein [Leclercia tamurae]MCU6678496.1 hypothetical protein [Leclercia tamurae]
MKQLTVFEMESIAGAYSWDFSSIGATIQSVVSNGIEVVTSAAVLGSAHAAMGSMIGGTHGSDNGGIFGAGTIGMAIGGAWGIVSGAITGAIAGAMFGWDKSAQLATDCWTSIYNGSHGIY